MTQTEKQATQSNDSLEITSKSNVENTAKNNDVGFEAGFSELEKLVARMESGDQTLQQSVDDFQTGIALIEKLQLQLEQAEQKIEILIKDSHGQVTKQPFDNVQVDENIL